MKWRLFAAAMVCLGACKSPVATPVNPPPAPEPTASQATPVEVRRDDLDVFAEQIAKAAARHDVEALRTFMDDVFITEPIAAPSDHDAVLQTWAEHPVVMNDLRRLLRGTCVFVNTLEWLMCPADLAGDAMYSDAGRIYLERRDDGWHWVGYLFDEETALNPDGLRAGPLSESPLFTEERPKPAAFRNEEEFEEDEPAAGERPVKRVPRIEPAKRERLSDKEIIRRVVRAHINDVRYCYNEGLDEDPELRGRVSIRFTIGPTGDVIASEVAQSDVPDAVGECIAEVIEFWKFPKPPDGSEVAITYPFVLGPG